MKPCCVPNCHNKSARRHAIPREKRIRDIWIQRINNPKLIGVDDIRYFKSYVVCDEHFEVICKDNEKLKKFALPTLHLPEYVSEGIGENCFSFPPTTVYVTPEKLRDALERVTTETSFGDSPPMHVQPPEKTYGKKLFKAPENVTEEENVKELAASLAIGILQEISEPTPSTSGLQTERSLEKVTIARNVQPSKKTYEKRLLGAVASTSKENIMEDQSVVELASSLGIGILPDSPEPATSTSGLQTERKRRKILQGIAVTRQQQLTPKAKFLYNKVRKLQHNLSQRRSAKKNLRFLRNNDKLFNLLDVNETTAKFVTSQLKTQKFKPRGRRFNIDDKIFALALYKQSGKAYRYLSNIFSLPSRKVLSSLLNGIPFECGINKHLFNHLKKNVEKKKDIEKYCSLIFDEISLECGLQYNKRRDLIEGFVDSGQFDRHVKFADHAQLFMLRGVYRKWKQPICFTFCEGTTSTPDLIRILKEIVREVRSIGLKIVCTICDQGATNQAAINELLGETKRYCMQNNIENRYQGYLIDNEEIIHLYDFPHLMKGIRNNLLNKNLHFEVNGEKKVASWSHIVQVYQRDKQRGYYSMFQKLTDEHVVPNKIKKMRVKNCTQVFSHTVGSALHMFAIMSKDLPTTSELYIDPKAADTAELLLFFDQLFDSINGSTLHPPHGKELRTVISPTSQHMSFWNSRLPVLNSMFFVDKNNKKTVAPSLKNWIFSIKSLQYLWKTLQQKGFKYLAPRNLNQDPVENYFCCIRSHGVRNINPTCSSFISSNKALLINNLVSSHSVSANCEEDQGTRALDTLKEFIENPLDMNLNVPRPPSPIISHVSQYSVSETSTIVKDYATPYVAGFVIKKIFSICKIDNCTVCKNNLCTQEVLPENILIQERHYPHSKLQEPTRQFSLEFKKITGLILHHFPLIITSFQIKSLLSTIIKQALLPDISALFCEKHQNCVSTFIAISINIIIFSYIRNINKILKGQDLRKANQDQITSLALAKYRKRHK